LNRFLDGRQLLILHGDEHPVGFSGHEWDDSTVLQTKRIYRSNVCSSAKHCRGVAHRISWDGNRFSCATVRGGSGSLTRRCT
jgi:hypothetical protein